MHILLTGNTAFKLTNFRAGLIRELRLRGHRLSALVPRDDHFETLRDFGVDPVDLEMDRRGTSVVGEMRLLFRIWRTFRTIGPDVVLGFTIKNNIYGALAARALGIPFIPNVTGLGTAFESQGLLRHTVIRLYRSAFRDVPKVFFQNTEDRDLFVCARIVDRGRTALLPGSGVDLAEFRTAPLPGTDAAPTFLLVARMLKDKGLFEFVEASRIVQARHADARFRLLGPLDTESHDIVDARQLREWEDGGTVEYIGAAKDVRPHIRAADCIVLPSYYKEGTPRALIEGAAMGRPLITTNMPGCRDVVEHGRTGFVCRARDDGDLAAKMCDMVECGSAARADMGMQGRRKMEREFDEMIVIAAYLEAIKEIYDTPAFARATSHEVP